MKYEAVEGWFYPDDVGLYEEMVSSVQDDAIFIEVGCFKGRSTTAMCELIEKYNKKINLFVVDHFKGSSEHQHDPTLKNLFQAFINNMKDYSGYFSVIPYSSIESAKFFKDKTVDFIYIDASHDYESVKQDLNVWFPKLKENGFIGGHDYTWEGVKQAVDEFAIKNNMQVKRYGAYGSWKLIQQTNTKNNE